MNDTQANARIAEAMGDEGWVRCPQCAYQERAGYFGLDCKRCNGTGKVPKDWCSDERTMRLWGWWGTEPEGWTRENDDKILCIFSEIGDGVCVAEAAREIAHVIAEALPTEEKET